MPYWHFLQQQVLLQKKDYKPVSKKYSITILKKVESKNWLQDPPMTFTAQPCGTTWTCTTCDQGTMTDARKANIQAAIDGACGTNQTLIVVTTTQTQLQQTEKTQIDPSPTVPPAPQK